MSHLFWKWEDNTPSKDVVKESCTRCKCTSHGMHQLCINLLGGIGAQRTCGKLPDLLFRKSISRTYNYYFSLVQGSAWHCEHRFGDHNDFLSTSNQERKWAMVSELLILYGSTSAGLVNNPFTFVQVHSHWTSEVPASFCIELSGHHHRGMITLCEQYVCMHSPV